MTDVVLVAIITGGFTLIASTFGLIISLFIAKMNKDKDFKLERIKIFDGNKFDAYIELYQFLRMVRSSYDFEEEFDRQFLDHLETGSYKFAIKKIGYYSKKIRKLLMDLDNQQIMMKYKNDNIVIKDNFNCNKYLKICDDIYNEVEKSFDNWDK